jgi:acyl-coenzyme A synthetase/AMP-(fatty) acid ligase
MILNGPEVVAASFRKAAEAYPNSEAIVFPEMVLNYRNLWQLTEAFALRLREKGVIDTSTIHVNSRDTATVLPALLATSLLGAKFLQNVGALDQPGLPEVTHGFHGLDVEVDDGSLPIDADWSPDRVKQALGSWPLDAPLPDPGVPWLIVYTSGTTGMPKFVVLTQRMVCRRSFAVADEFLQNQTRFVSLYPTDSRPFFARALAALLHGATLIDAPHSPETWAEFGVTRVVGSPAAVASALASHLLSPKVPVLEVAGGAVPPAQVANLLQSFEFVDDTYGATETSKSFSTLWTLGADGRPFAKGCMRDSVVEIVNEAGVPLPPDVEGVVRVKNDYMATGYLNDALTTARAFKGGWFLPGDRARWGQSGELVLSPRGGDVLNLGGSKIGLTHIDRILATDPDIKDAACFQSPKSGAEDKLIAFVILADGVNAMQVVARAQKRCSDTIGAAFTPTRLWPIDTIPRLADGSPDREACRRLILEAATRQENAAARGNGS